MTPCELTTGTGLEVSLELERGLFLVELDDDKKPPWPACGRMA
jgi:hypothetical protein